ncbi:abscisic acid 8'-hydroxylase 4 [Selaginella moellendorffii]|nr:abscisic acid 8'-hydroxylase 4 [Selaginella moellendorffii]|eukprot:XP_002976478.2 abscisic acid 8'-hydroxylase 4 [Selaginella moellendorffii]
MELVMMLVGIFLGLVVTFFMLKQSRVAVEVSSTSGAKTPPGPPWRIPLVGETLSFLRDPHRFYLTRIARYGEIFSTSLFGDKCIIVTTPEASKWLLQSAQKFFKPAYPESANSLIDPTRSFGSEQLHNYVRRIVGSSLYPESLQFHVPAIEALACSVLDSWTKQKSINVYSEMAKYTFEVAMKILCGMEPGKQMDALFQNMQDFEKAFLTLNINLPFTTYRRGLKARDSMFKAVEEMIQQRRKKKRDWSGREQQQRLDMLDSMICVETKDEKFANAVTDIHVRGIIMTILFAGHETSAAQLVWAIKNLHDNPELLHGVKEEHEAIRRKREPGSPLTWSQVMKEMPLTLRVINETMRTSYVGLFLPREALDDLEYDGYYFPKGWKVYASPSMVHLNPKLYTEPYKFDPTRFQDGGPKPNTFIPFGNGQRLCLGGELAKVEMLVLIHHLVTTYSWKIKEDHGGIRWWPVPIPKGGLVIQVEREVERGLEKETRQGQTGELGSGEFQH